MHYLEKIEDDVAGLNEEESRFRWVEAYLDNIHSARSLGEENLTGNKETDVTC